ncbi:hypothetical protein [Helicobacter vulpis]|uniref:hypothetical protein n=1 Tax=Helicobacter vulpis TaxID=2316076 RepID=UPI000EB2DB31|nr:hypothetical protein [Helicobacter vulpis]
MLGVYFISRSFHGFAFAFICGGGGGVALALLLTGCTTKLADINPNQPISGDVKPVYGSACSYFTWPYGNADDLKQEALQQAQQQANAFAQSDKIVAQTVARSWGKNADNIKAKQWELINTKVTKTIWPWFWWLLGQKCVYVRGYARPVTH